MLSCNAVTKSFGGRDLLADVSFRLAGGEKVALVGVNGSGKTTLLRMCAGLIELDGGQVSVPRDFRIGYLPQQADLNFSRTLADELRQEFAEVDRHMEECERLAHKMAELDHGGEPYERVAARYGYLQHELERLGAYELDSRIEKIASGLGFAPTDLERPCSEFSGGWQMRILLARLLLSNPDVLLLDEPTNHLDLETMIWLENWIRESDAAVLLVSHERRFMDALAQRVFEVHEGKFVVYRGNYTQYLRTREERWEQWRREYENQREEIAHIQRFIDRFRYNNRKAVLVQSRIKKLEKIERIPPPPKAQAAIHFRFPPPGRSGKEVLSVKGLGKSYGELEVLSEIDFTLWRAEKIALVGLNGAGKTTLLKILAGVEPSSSGEIVIPERTRAEYFAQYDGHGMNASGRVWDEIASVAPAGHLDQARKLLGGFFFSADDLEKPISVLSGGEGTRLRLAKMLFSGANLLLLDEPTNHLDIASRATLERAICDYPGSVLLVSHDRFFLDAVATRIFEIKDGRMRAFPGNYTDYCRALAALGETSLLVDPALAVPSGRGGSRPRNRPESKGRGGRKRKREPSAPQVAPAANSRPKGREHLEASRALSREQRRIEKLVRELESEIAKIEQRQGEVEAQLAKPEIYRDYNKSAPLIEEQTRLKEQHSAFYAQWEHQASTLER